MFSKELQQLIEASLVDGVLTDQERAVIRKRALLDGVDPDEVDVLLDAELQRIRQKQEEAVAKVKKCPNCGEIIPALSGVCPSCNYVISATKKEDKELVDIVRSINSYISKNDLDSYDKKELAELVKTAKILYGENIKVNTLVTEAEKILSDYKRKLKWKKIISTIILLLAIVLFVLEVKACNQPYDHWNDIERSENKTTAFYAFGCFVLIIISAWYKLWLLAKHSD